MNNEFKKIKAEKETRYVLETMTAGATGASSIATSVGSVGKVQKRQDNILAQEADKITIPVTQKPRQGPLRPQTGGGKHRDKKKEQKQGKEKHRKPFAEDHEISMASNELKSITADAMKLLMLIKRYSEMDGLEAWQQSKITKAADYLNSVLQSINGDQTVLEGYGRYGRSSWDSNMPDWQRREQDAWDDDKRAFKYAELQHELGHEEEPYRSQRRFSSASSGMYFYNVKPGQESDALAAGLKQTKNGKWYSKTSNPAADKTFGPGKFWQPKSESLAESKKKPNATTRHLRDYPVSDKDVAKPVKKPEKKKSEQGVAEADKKKMTPTSPWWGDDMPGKNLNRKPADDKKKKEQGVAEGLRDPKDNPCWKGYKPVGTKKKGGRTVPNCVPKEGVSEVAPPGWEKTVKAMKKHDEIDNPYALAWSMKNKGYKSHKKESAVGEAVPSGNEADVRRKLIKYIAQWKDWGISDLELAKTDELIAMYKECQKEKKDWLKRRSDWWNKGDELAKQKGINKLDALAQVPHDLDRDNAQGQFNFKEDAYTSSLFNQLEERTKK